MSPREKAALAVMLAVALALFVAAVVRGRREDAERARYLRRRDSDDATEWQ